MQSRKVNISKFIVLVLVVFISLQFLNQLLIYSGIKILALLDYQNEYEVLINGIFQQTIQFITAIILSKIMLKKEISEIGLNFWNFRMSVKYFVIFALSILSIYLIYINVARLYFPQLWLDMRFAAKPSNLEISTKVLFQSIFPGLGEELLFRGFLISLFITKLNPDLTKFFNKFFVSILSAVFFAIAHIYFNLTSLQITHIDVTQLLLALFSGTCYSFMFIKTKSLVGPILSHNFANVASTVIGLLISKM
jgi:membrane protease YdiL (CAAX protease family)